MTELRDLVDPMLSDPPHAAPPLDELQRRVDRRRRRRARAIGAASVFAVVLVAAAVLALPRDAELRVGGGTSAPTTQAPPPLETGPIQLVVTPESAPAATERTIEIRNTSGDDYTTCGTYDLFRWDGETWSAVVRVYLGGGGTMFGTYDPSSTTTECSWSPISIAAGETTSLGFDPDTSVRWAVTATAPPGTAPLADGWYELREPPDGASGNRPSGRFEITSEPVPAPPPPAPDTTTTTTGDEAPVTVDLYPLDLEPAGEVLPTAMYAVDQDTIAVAWTGPCNEPADHVTFAAHDGEIELRLDVGQHVVIDCMGESDDWMVTFDVPFHITDGVRLVARAQGVEGETELQPGIIIGVMDGASRLPDGSAVSFRTVEDGDPAQPGVRFVDLLPPMPLGEGFACDVSAVEIRGVFIPQIQVQERSAAGDVSPCATGSFGFPLTQGATVFGWP